MAMKTLGSVIMSLPREPDDLASNLEFWSGRVRNGSAGEDPRRRRRRSGPRRWSWPRLSLRRGGPAPKGRARPVAAAALLATLTAAWLMVGHSSHSSVALDAHPDAAALAPPAPAPSSAPPSTTTTVPRTPGCRGLAAGRPEVRCVIDAVDLDVRLVAPEQVTAVYEHATGAHPVPGSGAPACARGVPDERSWSVAASTPAAVGRYLCRFEHGRAAMWWTHGDRLAHAVARDGDLAGLFSWWRAHPAE